MAQRPGMAATSERIYKPTARYTVRRATPSATNELESLIRQQEDGGSVTNSQIQELESFLQEPSCRFYMWNVKDHRRKDKLWFSDPFYSGPQEYKFRLIIYANGEGEARGQNLSAFVEVLEKNGLPPFRGSITVLLMDQSGFHDNLRGEIKFDEPAGDQAAAARHHDGQEGMRRARVAGGKRVVAPSPHRHPLRPIPRIQGIQRFARLRPNYNSPYEKNDMSVFEVSVIRRW